MSKQLNMRITEEDEQLLELLRKHYNQGNTWLIKEGLRRMFDQDVKPALIDKAISRELNEAYRELKEA